MRRLKLIQPRTISSRNTGSIRMALLAVLGLMTLGIAWAGDDSSLNQLTHVEVQETDQATKIVVTGSAPPTFTVFKLSDPTRLFVDVSNADVSSLKTVQVGNGVVASVAPLQYNDDLVRVGRIVVQLDVDTLYKVSAKGNALHIQIDAAKRQTRRPVAAGVAPDSQIVARASHAEKRAARAEAAAAAAQLAAAEAQAAAGAAEARATEAETRLGAVENHAQSAEARAASAESRAKAAEKRASAADRIAQQATAKARAAEAAADGAEARAQNLEATASQAAQRLAAARAAAEDAAKRANSAESKQALAAAKAAEAASSAAAAKAQVARLQADKARLSAKVETLDRRRAQATAEVARLEAGQDRLTGALAAAEADRDKALTKSLQAEQKAQTLALRAEKAQLAQIESARAKSAMDQKMGALQTKLANAKAKDSSAEVQRLQKRLAALEGESSRLKSSLNKRDMELVAARKRADTQRAKADKLAAATPKASRKKAAAVAKVANVQRTQITDVSFDDDETGTRVKITFKGAGDFELKSEGKRTRILEFVNAEIDPSQERSLDTGAFKSAVELVSSFQAAPPSRNVRIVATLSEDVKSDVKAANGVITWHFAEPRPAALAAAPAPTETPYATPRAAAYIGAAAPAASASRNRITNKSRRNYRGRKINIDIKDGDIHNVLRLLAKEGNINIVTADNVSGTVTIHLKMVPWDEALDIVIESKGLGKQVSGTIWRIAPKEELAKELEYANKILVEQEKLRPTNIRLMTVNHARATELVQRVKEVLSDRGTVSVDERTNTLILKDVNENLDAAEDMIRRLDTQTPQVLIEARIVEVNSTSQRELGIQWGGDAIFSAGSGNPTGLLFPSTVGLAGGSDDPQTPAGGTASTPNFVVNLPAAAGGGSGGSLGMTFGTLDNTINLNVRLSALQSEGTVKIVSSPKITTLDNREAIISQGVSIPISQVSATGVQTTFFDANLELKVQPQVTQDGNVYLQLQATNNTPDFQNVGARGDPTILKKEAKTQLLLKDGDTTVIGGIYTSNTGFTRSEVPFFASIPIVGALFRKSSESERRTELLIFVTPRIVNRRAATVRTAQ